MLEPGNKVHVLDPFADAFPGVHEVESIEAVEGGTVVHLVGIESAFDPKFLEVAP